MGKKYRLPSLDPPRAERFRRAMVGAALVVAIVIPLLRAFAGLWPGAGDTHAYWAVHLGPMYAIRVEGVADAYFYSPAFAQAIAPLTTTLAWPQFLGLWTGLLLSALVLMAGAWTLPLLLATPVINEVILGNIHILIGLVAAYGIRRPALWAFVLLTKITPGIGLLWFAFRREWRSLAIALGATAAIVAVSAAIDSQLWRQWIELLAQNRDFESPYALITVPLWARLAVAVVLIGWGARTERPWVVPVAAWLALPVSWLAGTAVLVGVIPLLRVRRPEPTDRTAATQGAPAA